MSLREKILGATLGVMGLTSVAAAEVPAAPEGGEPAASTTQPKKLSKEELEAERKRRNEALAEESRRLKEQNDARRAGINSNAPPVVDTARAAPEEIARKLAEQQAILDKYEEERKKNPDAKRPGLSGSPIKPNPGVAAETVRGFDNKHNINPETGKPINPTSEKTDEWGWGTVGGALAAIGLVAGAVKNRNFFARRREKKELEALSNRKPSEAGQGGTAAEDSVVQENNRRKSAAEADAAENLREKTAIELREAQRREARELGGEAHTVDVEPAAAFRGGNAEAVEEMFEGVVERGGTKPSGPVAPREGVTIDGEVVRDRVPPTKQAGNMFPDPAAGAGGPAPAVSSLPPSQPSARKPPAPKPD